MGHYIMVFNIIGLYKSTFDLHLHHINVSLNKIQGALMPTIAVWVQLCDMHPVPDRVKPSFVIFDIWALWRSALSVRVPGCQNLK